MKVLLVHPAVLLYAEVYLRLEPLGMECVAAAARAAGHEVRILDLQVFGQKEFARELRTYPADAVGFSLNYLANVPEVVDMARAAKQARPQAFVFVGGHSASFIPEELLEHAQGAIDCVVQGEGEITVPLLLERIPRVRGVPGVVTREERGPAPPLLTDLSRFRPARDLTRRRRKYFIGELDPCASIEFSRGCPYDCTFCSAWTFYGRSYRQAEPEVVAEEMASIREPNLFIVDDVAFVNAAHGMAIADQIERRGLRKRYYLETRCDTLIRNEEVFARWARLGLEYMFLGLESLDAGQLELFRKRVTPSQNFRALEIARKLGIDVAINLIVDANWGREDFERAIAWATNVPEIVHLTVATPYPGTELFHAEPRELSTTDYRLFDIQHAVLPTKLPLHEFYEQLVRAESVISAKFMGWRTALSVSRILARQLIRGQTNFLKMLFRFSKVFNAERFYADHSKPVRYELRKASEYRPKPRREDLLVHRPRVVAPQPDTKLEIRKPRETGQRVTVQSPSRARKQAVVPLPHGRGSD